MSAYLQLFICNTNSRRTYLEFTRLNVLIKVKIKTVFVPGTDVSLHSDDGHGEYR